MIELDEKEKESCRKGRKVQILILLEKNERMTFGEIKEAIGYPEISTNLGFSTKRLEANGLIETYDESRFKDPAEVNLRFKYASITEAGRELIADLGR